MSQRVIDLGKVGEIARSVGLTAVCWRSVSSTRHIEQEGIPADLRMLGDHEATGVRSEEANEILVLASFRFRADESETEKAVAEVRGTLALRYVVTDGSVMDFDPKEVQDFAEVNGVYNAWPYWRELVQSLGSRIGMHGIIAPVFRIPSSTETKNDENQDKESVRTE